MARTQLNRVQPATPPSSLTEWVLAAIVVAAPVLVVNWAFTQQGSVTSGPIRVTSQAYYAGPLVDRGSSIPPINAARGAFAAGQPGGKVDDLLLIPAQASSLSISSVENPSVSGLNGLSNPGASVGDSSSAPVKLLVQAPRTEPGPSLISLPTTTSPASPTPSKPQQDPLGRSENSAASTPEREQAATAREAARLRRIIDAEPRDFVANPPYPIPDYTSRYRESHANPRHYSYAIAPPGADRRTADIMAGYSPLSRKTPDSPMDGWKSVGVDPWGRSPAGTAGTGANSNSEQSASDAY